MVFVTRFTCLKPAFSRSSPKELILFLTTDLDTRFLNQAVANFPSARLTITLSPQHAFVGPGLEPSHTCSDQIYCRLDTSSWVRNRFLWPFLLPPSLPSAAGFFFVFLLEPFFLEMLEAFSIVKIGLLHESVFSSILPSSCPIFPSFLLSVFFLRWRTGISEIRSFDLLFSPPLNYLIFRAPSRAPLPPLPLLFAFFFFVAAAFFRDRIGLRGTKFLLPNILFFPAGRLLLQISSLALLF